LKAVNGVLADHLFWIDFLKAAPTKLRPHGRTDQRKCALRLRSGSLFELLQGVRTDAEKTHPGRTRGLSYYEMTPAPWHYAAVLSEDLRKSGTTVPLSDILITALAHQHGLIIFTHTSILRKSRVFSSISQDRQMSVLETWVLPQIEHVQIYDKIPQFYAGSSFAAFSPCASHE
jgi:predicted nucleic acid-binding protein